MIDVSLVKQTNKKLLYSKNNVSKSLFFFFLILQLKILAKILTGYKIIPGNNI